MAGDNEDTHPGDGRTILPEIRAELTAMEDDLRILHGAMASLKLMGWSNQPADPAALAFLARFADEALERTKGRWASLVGMTRQGAE